MLRSVRLALAFALAFAVNAHAAPPPKRLTAAEAIKRYEGVYKHRFDNASVQGDQFVSEDILEIASYGTDKVYFRLHLEFFNAHLCDLYGIATYEDRAFVFRDPEADPDDPCTLRLRLGDEGVTLDDENGTCRSYYCGARGGFDQVTFPTKSRRTIRYMRLLRGSSEYQEAVESFEKAGPRE